MVIFSPYLMFPEVNFGMSKKSSVEGPSSLVNIFSELQNHSRWGSGIKQNWIFYSSLPSPEAKCPLRQLSTRKRSTELVISREFPVAGPCTREGWSPLRMCIERQFWIWSSPLVIQEHGSEFSQFFHSDSLCGNLRYEFQTETPTIIKLTCIC